MSQHHLFSPSAAHRWLACPPSLALSRKYPNVSGPDAILGTQIHAFCAEVLLGGTPQVADPEARANVNAYADYVRALGGVVEVEVYMVHPDLPELGGTADAIVWVDDVMHVIDYKNGSGVRVDCEGNPQLALYGVLALKRAVVPINKVVLHIYQPRMSNISTFEITPAELDEFELLVRGAMLSAGPFLDGLVPRLSDYVPGEGCRWCPHAGNCEGLAEHSITVAQQVFDKPVALPTRTLAEILTHADMIDAWVAAVRKEALERALAGQAIEGFKLAQKRGMRAWTSEADAVQLADMLGVEIHGERPVLSPPQVEKRLGPDQLAQFKPLVTVKSSGLTLVPLSDKRAAVDPKDAPAVAGASVFSMIGD